MLHIIMLVNSSTICRHDKRMNVFLAQRLAGELFKITGLE